MPCIATSERERSGIEEEEEEEEEEDAPPVGSSETAADASRSAENTAAVCAGPEGAVRPEGVPACLTLEPRSKPRGGGGAEAEEEGEERPSSVVVALRRRRSSSAATPSPLPYPSASESKGLHLPEGDSACSWQMPAKVAGSSMRCTPAATAPAAQPSAEEGDEPSPSSPSPSPSSPPPPPQLLLSSSSRALLARWTATSELEHAV